MKQTVESMPTANIAVNKSRLKMYNKKSDVPTFYLQKGQEFQIELFNPTTDTVLTKISLNNNPISQGGLILRPGERVFLDRYLDVAKKFKFDTYEVANSKAAQKAIEENGDFKVEFYRESQPLNMPITIQGDFWGGYHANDYHRTGIYGSGGFNTTTFNANLEPPMMDIIGGSSNSVTSSTLRSSSPTKKLKSKKKVETGRVEQGSESGQKLKSVNKTFEYSPFHVLEYKLLPVSQKINTTNDVKIKKHCTECGAKAGRTHKYCNQCGNKL